MNPMNMAGMNAMGGPVGGVGGMPMMNSGSSGGSQGNPNSLNDYRVRLNTGIYEYLLRNELYDAARAMVNSNQIQIERKDRAKTSPGRRRDGDMNGADDSMDGDMKDDLESKIPEDLPLPSTVTTDFLFGWWCVFWDLFLAQRKKTNDGGAHLQYIQHTQQQSRMRQEQQQAILRQMNPQMMSGPMNQYQMMRGMQANGLTNQDLQRKALHNSRNAYVQPTPQQQMQLAKMQQQQQMQRDGSDVDINGQQRPQSPSSAENAPSPSKRPRLDGGPFNGQQMGPNGRPMQGMQGQQMNNAQTAQAMSVLNANGIDPSQLNTGQFNSFRGQNSAVQAKSIQVYAQNLANQQRQAMPKPGNMNVNGMPNQGSPMMQQNSDMGDFYANHPQMRAIQGMQGMPGMQGPQGQGNHALQDYQMQLMLLEQQNKRRLMMARQEQDMARTDGPPGPNGAPGPGFQNMSPQGSRTGQSPGPNDQMKRGTPKMTQSGLPGSPLPDGTMPQARGSPAAMNFAGGQMPPEMTQQFYQMKAMEGMVGPNGNMMRPPSSHPGVFPNGQQMTPQQIEAMARSQQGRMPSGNWQQGPQQGMMQQPQGQPQQMGTPRQTNMPPPQAPATNANQNRPASPQQPAAPPTPQQTNKPNPKKKEGKEGSRKRQASKKGGAANAPSATPTSEAQEPPTPTPSTPITPVHPNSFNQKNQQNNGNQQAAPQPAAPVAPAPAPAVAAPPPPDPTQGFSMDNDFNLDFSGIDSADVLENFDFDSFLNTGDGDQGPSFDFQSTLSYGNADGSDMAEVSLP